MALYLAVLLAMPVDAAVLSELLPTRDGSAVFLKFRNGPESDVWRKVERGAVAPAPWNVQSISADGATIASANYGERSCGAGFYGTCFTSAYCQASFSIAAPGANATGSFWRTAIDLSPNGRFALIEQNQNCFAFGVTIPKPLNGLYEVPSLNPIRSSDGLRAASSGIGQRVVTDDGRALVRSGDGRLLLLGNSGVAPIETSFPASEAVIDATGQTIVYVGVRNRLRLKDLARGIEEDILTGQAPQLSEDGRVLAFRLSNGEIAVWRREARIAQALKAPGAFALSGDGRFLFLVTEENALFRVDLAAGAAETWLEPMPELDTIHALAGASCPWICYVTPGRSPGRYWAIGPSQVVLFKGNALNLPGWRVRFAGFDLPLHSIDSSSAWFQVPSTAAPETTSNPFSNTPFVIEHPDHPLRFEFGVRVWTRALSCFGSYHEDFASLVSADSPARIGEIVHVFLTGLKSEVPDGEPNPVDRLVSVVDPPQFVDADAFEALFFGLAPGLIGIQQLDMRILGIPRYYHPGRQLFDAGAAGCVAPPTTE